MSLKDRVNREKASHEEEDILENSIKLKNRFHHIYNYPSLNKLLKQFNETYEKTNSLRVLDYGCGKGLDSLRMLKAGATVYGIDISEKYIEQASNLARDNNIQESKYQFQVMDAHNLKFEDNYFDLVIGNGILHHLDYEIAFKSIHRVLRKGGRLVFREPLGDNPLLKIFRFFTPKARTIDEKPFSGKDLKKIIDLQRWDKENTLFCGLISAPIAVFTSIIMPKNNENFLLKISNYIENKLNKYEFFKAHNQYVLFDLKKK
tara:strand:+ start:201 stop:983 length:783 start_codon:yes stop_codon:yes gene_type:complete